ncbi:MAG TPA: hypothetical protein DCP92_00710 [Nitrospiraceae bacterium]|nr:hypothetical protein [Nitrospiraceae bacterium]
MFKKVIDIIIKLMIPFVILALITGTAKLFLDLREVFKGPASAGAFDTIVTNILSMFVLINFSAERRFFCSKI